MRASPSYSGPKVRKGSTAVHPLSWEIGSSGWRPCEKTIATNHCEIYCHLAGLHIAKTPDTPS